MMTTQRIQRFFVAILAMGLMACSDDKNEPAPSVEPQSSGIVPQYQMDTLKRAKATEGLLLDADEQRRKQLESMSQ